MVSSFGDLVGTALPALRKLPSLGASSAPEPTACQRGRSRPPSCSRRLRETGKRANSASRIQDTAVRQYATMAIFLPLATTHRKLSISATGCGNVLTFGSFLIRTAGQSVLPD